MVLRFEFPERPGALFNFLNKLGGRWNISMFHYRNHGAADGRWSPAWCRPSATWYPRRWTRSATATGMKATTPPAVSRLSADKGKPMEHYLTLRIVHGATAVLLLLGVIVHC